MKVSVLIPAYNVEKYITKCLESVCGQTHRDLQIVVIDDGSNDATSEVVTSLAEKDKRIELISRENRGVAQTRNELLDHAKGNAILFVDSDDWIEPDMISTLVDMMEDAEYDMVMCHSVAEYPGKKVTPNKDDGTPKIWRNKEILEKFLEHREFTGSLWNKLIKKEHYNRIRFTVGIGYGEDAMVMWDILKSVDKMAVTSKELYHYRMNDASISHQGLSESKMSVIPVWEYISGSELVKQNNLTQKAKARYGAEITLLLYTGVRGENSDSINKRIKILLKKLKELYPDMIKSRDLSYKLKLFAGMMNLSYPLLNSIYRIKKYFVNQNYS